MTAELLVLECFVGNLVIVVEPPEEGHIESVTVYSMGIFYTFALKCKVHAEDGSVLFGEMFKTVFKEGAVS